MRVTLVAVAGGLQASGAGQDPPQPAPPQQPSEVAVVISGDPGTPPRYAVPDFVALTPDAAEQAKTIAQVLFDDLSFEREFYLIPRDTYATVPQARTADQVPFAAWRELGADAVVFGTVQRTGNMVRVEIRLFNVRTRASVFAKEYSGTDNNVRLYAHTMSDEIHQQQRALRGVARTKLTFSSDRNREKLVGSVENRDVKEVYISDYDGAGQRRITTNRQLNIMPVWSPDARAIAYTSYRRGYPDIFVALIYQGLQEEPTKGRVTQNWLPMYSPDGTRICFTSNRDGNPGALRDEPGRVGGAAAHEPSGDRHHADVVADRDADRVHLRPRRHAADLRHRRRRLEPAAADDDRIVRRSARRGRRRRSTRSRTRGARGPDTTSRFTTWPAARRGRSRSAKAPTRARPFRPMAATSRSRRRGLAACRSSRSAATAVGSSRSHGMAITTRLRGRTDRRNCRVRYAWSCHEVPVEVKYA